MTTYQQSTISLDIAPTCDAHERIIDVLKEAIGQQLRGDAMRSVLNNEWYVQDFCEIVAYKAESFFLALRNVLRDYGVIFHTPSMASNKGIPLNMVQFVWSDSAESELK